VTERTQTGNRKTATELNGETGVEKTVFGETVCHEVMVKSGTGSTHNAQYRVMTT
jgi:hypothetical protein